MRRDVYKYRRIALTIQCLALAASLTGCYLGAHTIYEPAFQDPTAGFSGKLIGNSCQGNDGPRSVLAFQHGGVELEVRAGRREQGASEHAVIVVSFLVPEGVTLKLESYTVAVTTKTGERFAVPATRLLDGGGQVVPLDATLVGRTREAGVRKYHALFALQTITARPLGESFSIELPSALVNGKSVRFPRVGFMEKTVPAVNHLNC